MIRIITNTTFGYWNGKFVEPKTKDSAPFSIDPKREAELVAQGIAEYVGTDEEAPAADTAGADIFALTHDHRGGAVGIFPNQPTVLVNVPFPVLYFKISGKRLV